MKRLLFIFFCLAVVSASKAQQVENLRFVYGGEEDKPHGTLVISVGQYVPPTDRGEIDSIFGKSIVTDNKTFESLKQFVRHSKYPTERKNGISDSIHQWVQNGYS